MNRRAAASGCVRIAVLATAAVLVSAAASAGSRGGSAATARNVGISFTCPNAICVVKPDGSGRSVFVTMWFDGYANPSWTRDGAVLAYDVAYSDTHRIHIFRVSTRTHDEFPLRGDARSYEPSWSPDGKRIAVTEITPPGVIYGENASTIKILSLATAEYASFTHYSPVTKPQIDRIDTEPAWSPDGRTIAFVRQTPVGVRPRWGLERKHAPPTIFLIRPDGSRARRLTRGRSPSWSPDGTHLVFALDRSVYEIRADGSARKRILSGFRHPLVRWSPDGLKLLIASGHNAWVTDADGRHRLRVLHERYDFWGLAWRPG